MVILDGSSSSIFIGESIFERRSKTFEEELNKLFLVKAFSLTYLYTTS